MTLEINNVLQGDCLEVLKTLPENSVDSIVTDPPYELGFMGKSWDNTGIANNVEMWKECLRVLKPGGHLLAFSGTRTYHRMASAIEDAGFEVRDMIEWVTGSGFPKSLNIGKAVDKIRLNNFFKDNPEKKQEYDNLKFEIKKLQQEYEDLYYEENKYKASYESEDTSRTLAIKEQEELLHKRVKEIEFEGNERKEVEHRFPDGSKPRKTQHIDFYTEQKGNIGKATYTKGTSKWEGWGTALKPAHEPICMARKPLAEKTVAENVLKYGTGGINIDESRVGTEDNLKRVQGNNKNTSTPNAPNNGWESEPQTQGRFPANLIHDNSEEVRECFPETKSGKLKSDCYEKDRENDSMFAGGENFTHKGYEADSGNASRFFKSIIYTAKASKSERGEENNHPTVKPIALMSYLIKMVTPKGGIVLDPFAGSGSTLVAAKQNGFQFIGIEMTEEYIPIIQARLSSVIESKQQVLI